MYKGFYGAVAPVTAVAAIAAVMAFQPAGSALAGEITSGGDKLSLSLSGQVNRGVLYADDGNSSEFIHVDNDNSSTRIRFIGKGKINDEVTVGTQIEVQDESNSTASVDIGGADVGGGSFGERKLEWYIDHARLGRIWVGQGDTASNGTSEVDLSGTGVIGYSGVADMAGGINFTGAGAAGESVGSVFTNMDGLSRDDRIRYDTPNFGGFKVSVSNAGRAKSDVALRYSGGAGGLKIAAAVAYAVNMDNNPVIAADGADVESQIAGSISLAHGSGISLTLAGGTQTLLHPVFPALEDPTMYYVKVGYKMGDLALAIDYKVDNDVDGDTGDEGTAIGLLAVKKIGAAATELYAGARIYTFSDGALGDADDITAVLVGARVKF